jgi:hypothetical protein
MWFRINAPDVADQTIDNETIIINFQNGAYYSTADTGSVIWEQIASGASVDQIVSLFTRHGADQHTTIEQAVRDFVADLERESLIVALERPPAAVDPAEPAGLSGGREGYQSPVLERFTDMQDLLLLDPIHDVDEQGWPTRKA